MNTKTEQVRDCTSWESILIPAVNVLMFSFLLNFPFHLLSPFIPWLAADRGLSHWRSCHGSSCSVYLHSRRVLQRGLHFAGGHQRGIQGKRNTQYLIHSIHFLVWFIPIQSNALHCRLDSSAKTVSARGTISMCSFIAVLVPTSVERKRWFFSKLSKNYSSSILNWISMLGSQNFDQFLFEDLKIVFLKNE